MYVYVAKIQTARRFINSFVKGTPNVLCVPSSKLSDNDFLINNYLHLHFICTGAIFKIVMSIYAQGMLPLPSLEEVLICSQRTTVEEVIVLYYCHMCLSADLATKRYLPY